MTLCNCALCRWDYSWEWSRRASQRRTIKWNLCVCVASIYVPSWGRMQNEIPLQKCFSASFPAWFAMSGWCARQGAKRRGSKIYISELSKVCGRETAYFCTSKNSLESKAMKYLDCPGFLNLSIGRGFQTFRAVLWEAHFFADIWFFFHDAVHFQCKVRGFFARLVAYPFARSFVLASRHEGWSSCASAVWWLNLTSPLIWVKRPSCPWHTMADLWPCAKSFSTRRVLADWWTSPRTLGTCLQRQSNCSQSAASIFLIFL